MSTVRVTLMPAFHYGDDAVLVTLDGEGARALHATIAAATGETPVRAQHGDVIHDVRIEPGAATIDITTAAVRWHLDAATARDILTALAALSAPRADGRTAGHMYIDLQSPADTLVLSRDEHGDGSRR